MDTKWLFKLAWTKIQWTKSQYLLWRVSTTLSNLKCCNCKLYERVVTIFKQGICFASTNLDWVSKLDQLGYCISRWSNRLLQSDDGNVFHLSKRKLYCQGILTGQHFSTNYNLLRHSWGQDFRPHIGNGSDPGSVQDSAVLTLKVVEHKAAVPHQVPGQIRHTK